MKIKIGPCLGIICLSGLVLTRCNNHENLNADKAIIQKVKTESVVDDIIAETTLENVGIYENNDEDVDIVSLEQNNRILQMIILRRGNDIEYKLGYLFEEDGFLKLDDAFSDDIVNLSSLVQMAENIIIYRKNMIDVCGFDILSTFKISKSQFEDIVNNGQILETFGTSGVNIAVSVNNIGFESTSKHAIEGYVDFKNISYNLNNSNYKFKIKQLIRNL